MTIDENIDRMIAKVRAQYARGLITRDELLSALARIVAQGI
jgi:outer membrane protein TolC